MTSRTDLLKTISKLEAEREALLSLFVEGENQLFPVVHEADGQEWQGWHYEFAVPVPVGFQGSARDALELWLRSSVDNR